MLLEERRSKILRITEELGFVSLQHLVAEIGASESTIRRDLEYLEAQDQIQRTRGGASYAGESIADFDSRRVRASRQKKRIAQHTVDMISPGETILLDGGTTTLEVARYLTGKPLQVLTNSMPIASLLMNRPEIELIFIGGYLYPKTGVALGELAVAALKTVHAGRLVMGTGGITAEGLFNSNALLVETERQMIKAADRVTLVADSSKFGQRALSHLCPLDAVHDVVTDDGISDEWRQTLGARGIRLEFVEAGASPLVAGLPSDD
ncbi:MAG: DeoR/GlpR family DNA-binding transcription regulator [Planctomycetaceae bacterium]